MVQDDTYHVKTFIEGWRVGVRRHWTESEPSALGDVFTPIAAALWESHREQYELALRVRNFGVEKARMPERQKKQLEEERSLWQQLNELEQMSG